MHNGLERIQKKPFLPDLRYYIDMCLERLRKATRILLGQLVSGLKFESRISQLWSLVAVCEVSCSLYVIWTHANLVLSLSLSGVSQLWSFFKLNWITGYCFFLSAEWMYVKYWNNVLRLLILIILWYLINYGHEYSVELFLISVLELFACIYKLWTSYNTIWEIHTLLKAKLLFKFGVKSWTFSNFSFLLSHHFMYI
jgi:hypothetical protein